MKLQRLAHRYRALAAAAVVPFAISLFACPATAEDPEKLPAGAKLAGVEAWPASIALKGPYDYRQLLLTGRLESGERIDLARMARIEISSNVATISPRGLVRPAADGSGELRLTVAGQTAIVPVHVAGLKEKYEASFVRDIMPVLSKVG